MVRPYLRVTGPLIMKGRHRQFDVECSLCGRTATKYLDNVRRGISLACPCAMNVKYTDPRQRVLSGRYNAMVQRCRPGTSMAKNYGDRGIKVLFENRAHYISWVLENLPHPTYRGVDIDRVDNSGHYEPGNLRLVTRSMNLTNRRGGRSVEYMGRQVALHHVWHLIRTDHPDFTLSHGRTTARLASGEPVAEVLAFGKAYSGGRGRPRTTSLTPDPAIVSQYRD